MELPSLLQLAEKRSVMQVQLERSEFKLQKMTMKDKFSIKLLSTCTRCTNACFSCGKSTKYLISISKLLILLPIEIDVTHNLFRVHFIDAVKVLDLKVMQQIFKKELTEFERGEVAIISVMKNIERREELLVDIIESSRQLENTNLDEDEVHELLDRFEIKLKELRALSIRTVELIVLWRD